MVTNDNAVVEPIKPSNPRIKPEVSVPSTLNTVPAVVEIHPKKEKKQKVTTTTVSSHVNINESDLQKQELQIQLLQQQLLEQQRKFEETLKSNQSRLVESSTLDVKNNKPNSSEKKRKNKEESLSDRKKQSLHDIIPTVPVSNSNVFPTNPLIVPNTSYDSDNSSESDFIFEAVNTVLKSSRQDLILTNQQQREQQKSSAVHEKKIASKPLPIAPVLATSNNSYMESINAIVKGGANIPSFHTVQAPQTTSTHLVTQPMPMTSPFVSSTEVISALKTSGTTHATHNNKKNIFASPKTGSTSRPNAPLATDSTPATTVQFNPNAINFSTLDWSSLVHLTRSHERFRKENTFEIDHTWVSPRKYGDWCIASNIPSIIAIDCEMCETADPVTNEKVTNALVRFSVVNGLNPVEVILDSLVVPPLVLYYSFLIAHLIKTNIISIACHRDANSYSRHLRVPTSWCAIHFKTCPSCSSADVFRPNYYCGTLCAQ